MARYAGRRSKSFLTILGEMILERAYYHCADCDSGFCPRDQALGLAAASLSPGVQRMIGLVGALVSFQEGSDLMRDLAGVEVDAKQVERTAEAIGAEIAEDEREVVIPSSPDEIAPTMYLGVDGTGIPMRASELEGRVGKQADGSAKTREVKVCAVWSAESRDKEGTPTRDEGSVTYSAAIESAATLDTDDHPSEFAERVMREACRRGFDRAGRQVVLGDGAAWIWNLAGEQFPSAIQIVDRFHVKEHLSAVAKAVYGSDSEVGKKWAGRRHEELDLGRFDAMVRAVGRHAARSEQARKCGEYLERNRRRMRYPAFHAAGLSTSTGVVEAGCKVAVATRLKRAGMHWSLRGANAILALRSCKLSGRFEDFWERRAQLQRTG